MAGKRVDTNTAENPRGSSVPRKRDPEGTRKSILDAARSEFCRYGYTGARVVRISKKSKSNMRMIYHYFGSKEGVYLAVLESVYGEIREGEQKLDIATDEPAEGMRKLVLFTFDFFAKKNDALILISTENVNKAKFLKRLPSVQSMMVPLLDSIGELLKQGERQGVFREGVDPVQLYVSIVAQSQLHILSRYTLSVLFNQDLSEEQWLANRRSHVLELILSYLMTKNLSIDA